MILRYFPFAIFCLVLLLACSARTNSPDPFKIYKYRGNITNEPLLGYDIEIFKKSRAWEIAKAVYEQDTDQIMLWAQKDTSLLSFVDEKTGMNLLDWAVFNYRYYSCRALLKAGSNPNLVTSGRTPFIFAASLDYSSIFLNLLLAYGGNVNTKIKGGEIGSTPLEAAAGHRLESVKILVNAGANVNYADEDGSALLTACFSNDLEVVYYLISEGGADYRRPLTNSPDSESVYYLVDVLDKMQLDKGSKRDKMRQKIIDYIQDHDTTDYAAPYRINAKKDSN